MIELREFQREAAKTIAARFAEYADDRVVTGTQQHPRFVPFYQSLSSITASGKTVILADAVAEIAAGLVPPIVLWLSKGKVVVAQTYANLIPGGKYHHLLGDMEVRALAEYDTVEVAEIRLPIVYFATVGTFNRSDKELSSLLVYQKSDIDNAEQSTWDALKERLYEGEVRRPLLIVYDEAQNLSDLQVGLLLELEPDAVLLASATMRLPARLEEDLETLRRSGRSSEWLSTAVDARAVADAGLIKNTIVLGGYRSPMEETVAQLLDDMTAGEKDAVRWGLEGAPKAIYVCNTNIVEGDANKKDDPKQPFRERRAPPILIWRYLTERRGVDPGDIAVYCTLSFDRNFPPPPEFRLFKGGDKDYNQFVAGDFHHVIFNLSLQEGWDDPLCYFAYIDKSMDSRVQVEQVAGRLLRQPGVKHYGAERLNAAHFYVRVDRNQVFADVLDQVERKLTSEAPQVRIIKKPPGKAAPIEYQPSEAREVPGTAVITTDAIQPVQDLIDHLTDYRHDDGTNTRAMGHRATVKRKVGVTASGEVVWEEFEQSSMVLARWVFTREVRHRHVGALGIAPTSSEKFDARVGIGSNAEAHIKQVAALVVDAYIDNAYLRQKSVDPYMVGPLLANADEIVPFKHSLHKGYDGLNTVETPFAHALDQVGVPWARNPSRTGYGIPLVSLGPTHSFYPDFLVWVDHLVVAVDTKGGHLLAEATARKLLAIEYPDGVSPKVRIRFVSEGKYTTDAVLEDKEGFTVWGLKQDGTRRVTQVATIAEAVSRVLST